MDRAASVTPLRGKQARLVARARAGRADTAAAQNTLLLGPLAAFLLYHLLAEEPVVVDVANAARTLLLNIQSCDWDQRLTDLFGISSRFLPQCRPIRHAYGLLANTDIPLTAVNGDQPAALFAEGMPDLGSAFINMGSGAFILFPTEDTLVRHKSLLSGLADYDGVDRAYYLEGTVNGAATALAWAKEYCRAQGVAEDLDTWLAAEPEPPVFINTVGGLGSPWWDSELQPHFLDRTEEACRRHPEACLAGVAESILFLLRANLDEAQQAGLTLRDIRASGGLARSARLCQGLADLTGLTVLRSRQSEGTAAGMAWLACGNRASFESLPTDSFQPKSEPKLQQRYKRFLAGIDEARR
ncbi:MAG: FGGY-family carbohydrate kinase [Haloechinothrix sp.]